MDPKNLSYLISIEVINRIKRAKQKMLRMQKEIATAKQLRSEEKRFRKTHELSKVITI